jgi:mannose-6-phosphate isomerase-like protein (cupin superfamily)
MTRYEEGIVEKGWGREVIFATNDLYCGKLLQFKNDTKCSMHFHSQKDETWYVLSGKFIVHWIDTTTSEIHKKELNPSSIWRNKPLVPHQLECLEEGTIIEVSTPDSIKDNFRVLPGNSQI